MFDAAMITAIAKLYPVEFFSLCALAAIMVPIGAILMVSMAMIMMGE